jgi:hypothetical protein
LERLTGLLANESNWPSSLDDWVRLSDRAKSVIASAMSSASYKRIVQLCDAHPEGPTVFWTLFGKYSKIFDITLLLESRPVMMDGMIQTLLRNSSLQQDMDRVAKVLLSVVEHKTDNLHDRRIQAIFQKWRYLSEFFPHKATDQGKSAASLNAHNLICANAELARTSIMKSSVL